MFANAFSLSMHNMWSVYGYCHTEFSYDLLLILLWFSGFAYDDYVNPMLAEHYDVLGYDLSFRGWTERQDNPPVLFFCIAL